MADFAVIDAAKAPRPHRPNVLAKRMAEYEGYVLAVKKGQVGRLAPSVGETARGLALRIGRAARRVGKRVTSWVADDVLYFRVD
jgi:hypothetical protein